VLISQFGINLKTLAKLCFDFAQQQNFAKVLKSLIMLEQLIYPALLALVTATVTWLLARRKNIAEGKMAEVDVDMKSAALYQQLLDDAIKRINELLKLADGQREQLALQREQIENLMEEMETLTTEIKKYKQLNGKSQ